jgi:GT2 family glycosyltransferase
MKNISILIPYQPDNGPRDITFNWIKKYYEASMPEAELCIGGLASGGLFNRSQAFNTAAKNATREILVLADGDVIYNPAIIDEAVKLLDNYPWVIPFRGVVNLSPDNTNRLLETEPNWPLNTYLDDYYIDNYYERFAGKLMVMRRKTFIAAGGYDERFVGWGGDDDAFVHALETLCGTYIKLENEVIHLWHPRTDWSNAPNPDANLNILGRYIEANGNKEAMLKLINER